MPIPNPVIYQLNLVQQGISPMIRRRLMILGKTTDKIGKGQTEGVNKEDISNQIHLTEILSGIAV